MVYIWSSFNGEKESSGEGISEKGRQIVHEGFQYLENVRASKETSYSGA